MIRSETKYMNPTTMYDEKKSTAPFGSAVGTLISFSTCTDCPLLVLNNVAVYFLNANMFVFLKKNKNVTVYIVRIKGDRSR